MDIGSDDQNWPYGLAKLLLQEQNQDGTGKTKTKIRFAKPRPKQDQHWKTLTILFSRKHGLVDLLFKMKKYIILLLHFIGISRKWRVIEKKLGIIGISITKANTVGIIFILNIFLVLFIIYVICLPYWILCT